MERSSTTPTTLIAYGVLVIAVVIAFLLPQKLSQSIASPPESAGNIVRLSGKIWDFNATHPDMQATPSDGLGAYAGLVSQTLGDHGLPTFDGAGNKVLSGAYDEVGNPIAPAGSTTSTSSTAASS